MSKLLSCLGIRVVDDADRPNDKKIETSKKKKYDLNVYIVSSTYVIVEYVKNGEFFTFSPRVAKSYTRDVFLTFDIDSPSRREMRSIIEGREYINVFDLDDEEQRNELAKYFLNTKCGDDCVVKHDSGHDNAHRVNYNFNAIEKNGARKAYVLADPPLACLIERQRKDGVWLLNYCVARHTACEIDRGRTMLPTFNFNCYTTNGEMKKYLSRSLGRRMPKYFQPTVYKVRSADDFVTAMDACFSASLKDIDIRKRIDVL